VRRQADRVRSLITDREPTAYIAVALPEEMPVTETVELERALRAEVGLGPDLVVMNGMLPRRFSAAELDRLARARTQAPATEIQAAIAVAHEHGGRARAQGAQLRRLRRATRVPVATLPKLLDGDLGRAELERLSGELERRLGARRAEHVARRGSAPAAEWRGDGPSSEPHGAVLD
jgi:hypothetical protein